MRVAFLGLGRMGAAMAGRLLADGHELAVYNRTAAKTAPLAEAGARVASSPREAAAGADAVFAMVADDDASRAVWLGEHGALAGSPQPGAFAAEFSTLSVPWVRELAGRAGERGLRYLDLPVTGFPSHAAAGELTLLAGGAEADLAAVRPLLSPLCQQVIHFGGVGSGSAYKLIVNLLGSVQVAATAEALLTAERAGLDLDTVADALATGAAASPQVIRNSRLMVDGTHDDPFFTGRLRLKDTRYGVEHASQLGAPAALGATAEAAYQRLVDAGRGDLSESKLVDVLRQPPDADDREMSP